MDIETVPEELRPFVKDQLDAGRTLDDIVCEGLRLLQFNEMFQEKNIKAMDAQIAEGIAAEGRGEMQDGDEAMAEIWKELEERRGGE